MSLPKLASEAGKWTCNECGSVSAWTPQHRWFGSLKQYDEGRKLHIVCSAKCRRKAEARGLVNDPQVKDEW